MQCFPLYSILKSVGNPVLDYLSLDIEGTELAVSHLKGVILKTFIKLNLTIYLQVTFAVLMQ